MATNQNKQTIDRRAVLAAAAATGATLALNPAGRLASAQAGEPKFKISLAEWSLHRMLRSGKLTNMQFPEFTKNEFGIEAVEYVNSFFKDKAKDTQYLGELKKRCDDNGVKSLLIMCDGEGWLGDPDNAKRDQSVDNHKRWVEAAKFLGCHSIRVNAGSRGDWATQVDLVADGLGKLGAFAKPHNINVIVENHGGMSSNAAWLVEVMEKVGMDNVGTLPDFGNFHGYDPYEGVRLMMPFAKAVSAKSKRFTAKGDEATVDYYRIMKIVLDAGYNGYCGVEWEGGKPDEVEGIKLTRDLLLHIREGGQPRGVFGQPDIDLVEFGDRKGWKIVSVDSEENASEDGRAVNIIDGNPSTIWHTEWSQKNPKHPHTVVIDMAKEREVKGLKYLARPNGANGRVKDFEAFISNDPKALGEAVAKGALSNIDGAQTVDFGKTVKGRFLAFRALSDFGDNPWTSMSELGIIE